MNAPSLTATPDPNSGTSRRVTRKIVAVLCQWEPADMSLLGTTSYAQLATWTCVEGAGIIVALAIWTSWQKKCEVGSLALSGAAAGCVLSCLIGLDISRTGSFAFPLIFAALATLSPHCGTAGVHETKLGSKDSQPSHPARNRPTRTGKSGTSRKKTVSAEKSIPRLLR